MLKEIAEPGFEDFNISRTIYFHFLSTIAFVEFRLATLRYFESPGHQAESAATIRKLLASEKPRIRAMRQIITTYPRIPVAEEAQKPLDTAEDLDQKLQNIANFSFQEGQSV